MSHLTPELKNSVEQLRRVLEKMGINHPLDQADVLCILLFLKLRK